MEATERTLALIKPDAVKKGVWLDIIDIYEQHGLTIIDMRILAPMPSTVAHLLYSEHEGRTYYAGLIWHMMSGVTIALLIEGNERSQLLKEHMRNKKIEIS